MYTATQVKNIPYYLLYFSCNLDHVIHDNSNLEESNKTNIANQFRKKYKNNPKEFMEFFNSSHFTVNGTLTETWEFIKKDSNSLQQFSNFHLIFDIILQLLEKQA